MIAIIGAILVAFFGMLALLLPASPFASITSSPAYDTALGWLNWLLPINDMLTLFIAWAGAIMVCVIAFVVLKFSMKFGMKISGI